MEEIFQVEDLTSPAGEAVLPGEGYPLVGVPPSLGPSHSHVPKTGELVSASERNPILAQLPLLMGEKETRIAMSTRGVPTLDESDMHVQTKKIDALAGLPFAYLANTAAVRFAQQVVAQVHASYRIRDLSERRYQRFLMSQGSVMRGAKVATAPDFRGSLTGTGFILAGPSGCGKTAFLGRLRALIGTEPFIAKVDDCEFRVLPILIVRWPDCSTLAEFLSNVKSSIFAELGLDVEIEESFRKARGSSAAHVTSGLCTLLNIGLFIVDGICMRSQRNQCQEILSFIGTLMQRSGIPVLLACTYPALQMICRSGPTSNSFASAAQEYWDLADFDERWVSMCAMFWKLGCLEPMISQPEFLAELLWDLSQGNMRICIAAINAIHHEHIFRPELAKFGTKDDYVTLLEVKLRLFKEPLSVLAGFYRDGNITPEDVSCFGDYLPYKIFSQIPSSAFERGIRKAGSGRVKL